MQLQVRCALVCNAPEDVPLGQDRSITPVTLSITLMWGILGISRRQLASNKVFALVLFGAAEAFGERYHSAGSIRPTLTNRT